MASVNKVILVGHLGKDPEVRHLEGGNSVANFTMATNEYYKDKQGTRVERTEWHNIAAWRNLAELAEKYLRKGHQVYVEGRIRTRQYQDKDNQTRYITEIIAEEITMLSSGRAAGAEAQPVTAAAAEEPTTFRQEPELNQLPF
ncbi:single-stranded DNA-binding protein [Hymenobacter taeanensis]|uniref:Single-stranded DNA-binding protein n=1 Tax=Hymenobacter taeanensis TaxID=2735321 RepID=A0A6M6BIN3_9BACT|nr:MULTISPECIES: single-stranded DNA-binding protein [Hymenobacter]QJX47173.1 single-stranded DNA-binding protein [Hymenobacter taeanensis]UOQ81090.1 single-stranded DNA-binding protein [Hymenobacter sp. 5414T-23]